MELVVGGGKLDRRLENVEAFVDAYPTDDGLRYLDCRPLTPPDRMVPGDLAVTILISSRVAGTVFKAVQDHGHELTLDALPDCALEDADEGQRQAVCDLSARSSPGDAVAMLGQADPRRRQRSIASLGSH